MADVNLDGIWFRAFQSQEEGSIPLSPPGDIPGAVTIDLSSIKYRAFQFTQQYIMEQAEIDVEYTQ